MIEYLSRHLSSMRRIFMVMITFGLAMGLAFPFIVGPFVTWNPERKIFFQFACLGAGFAVGTFCYLLIKATLFQRNRLLAFQKAELEKAKARFSMLTRSAIESQDWEVSFHDVNVPTCWKLLKCDHESCPAFGREHIRCWLLAGTFCGGEVQGRFAQKLGDCGDCRIYRAAVGDNPISEIGENFNSLMLAVREKEDLLGAANEELQKQYVELEELHRQAREMADTDLLTGLRNHAHFQQHLRWEIARAGESGSCLSLVMLDLDYFKLINDRYGHQKGDEALRRVGQLLRESMPETAYAARYGGEEFAIVLPDTGAGEAMAFAERVRQKMSEVAPGMELPPKVVAGSFGVADFPVSAEDAESLVTAADSAMLYAKRSGRNRVAYHGDLSTDPVEEDIDHMHSRLEGAGLQTIRALAEAVDQGDGNGSLNAEEIDNLAAVLGRKLGLEGERADCLILAARLHDIGKIGVPEAVLRKKDKLSTEEFALVCHHPEIGRQILEEARRLKELISAILYHHEHWDGSGYPDGLQGRQIPLMARVIGILDAYRAMLSDRPYRKALSKAQALEELRAAAGKQFDPGLIELFAGIVEEDRGADQSLRPAI